VSAAKPFRLALTWILIPIVAAGLAWSGGFLYWQVRLSKTVAAAGSEVRNLPQDQWAYPSGFEATGSRAFPRLLEELRRAIVGQDRPMAFRWCQELAMQTRRLHDHLDSAYFVPTATHLKIESSWDNYRAALTECEHWWLREQPNYPPWWMWWSGKRRTP
jgi:hypothetical protein